MDLDLIKAALAGVSEDWFVRYGVTRIGVFGSRLRGDARPDSDLDVLIRIADPLRVSLFDLQRMSDELAGLLGCRIDLVLEDGLKPAIGRQIRQEIVFI